MAAIAGTSIVPATPPATAAVAAATPAHPAVTTKASTRRLLADLPVSSGFRAGYERTAFTLWTSHPDGCNTRDKVLIRDAKVKPRVGPGCELSGGTWVSPYDGYRTHDPSTLQIDHVVALGAAWGAGAWRWDSATRRRFANDLGTSYDLLAVSAHENESKGDQGPEEWLPDKHSFRCRYMADYVGVLWRWHLHTNPVQRRFLTHHLRACGWPTVVEPRRPTVHYAHPAGGHDGGGSAHGVRIAAIYFDSPGSDTGSNVSLDAEWVKLTNASTTTATLTGATLRDTSGHVYAFPSFRLASHASVKVHTGRGSDGAHDLYWDQTSYIWNNTGDTATLRNAAGDRVDSCSYTAASDPEAGC